MFDYVTIAEIIKVASELAMYLGTDDDEVANDALRWYQAAKAREVVVIDQEGVEYPMSRDVHRMLKETGFIDNEGKLTGYSLLPWSRLAGNASRDKSI